MKGWTVWEIRLRSRGLLGLSALLLMLGLAGCSFRPAQPLFVVPAPTQLPLPKIRMEALPTLLPTQTADLQTGGFIQTPIPETNLLEETEQPDLFVFSMQPDRTMPRLRSGQHTYRFRTAGNETISFLMYIPAGYQPDKKWPLILYLHSSIEMGEDLNLLRQRALPKKLDSESAFPFVVISPQISEAYWYQYFGLLEEMLTGMEVLLPLDTQREYLTGFSLGGYGVWAYAYHYPNRFAAIAPVSGSLDEGGDFFVPADFCRMRSVPVWAFHGELDVSVSPEEDQRLIDALSACGGQAMMTLYPGIRHLLAAEMAYADPLLYEWFLSYQR